MNMSARDFLAQAQAENVEIRLIDGKLKVLAPPPIRARWIDALRPIRDEVIALLQGQGAQGANDPHLPPEVSRWVIGMPDGTEADVVFCPAVDDAEVRARYPEAVAIRPAPLPADQPEPLRPQAPAIDPDRLAVHVERLLRALDEPEAAIAEALASIRTDPRRAAYWQGEVDLVAQLVRTHEDRLPRERGPGWMWFAIPELARLALEGQAVAPDHCTAIERDLILIAEHARALNKPRYEAKRALLQCTANALVRAIWLDAARERLGEKPSRAVEPAWRPWLATFRLEADPASRLCQSNVLLPAHYSDEDARKHGLAVWGEDRFISIEPVKTETPPRRKGP